MDYKNYHLDKTYRENESLFKNIFTKRFLITRNFVRPWGVIGRTPRVLEIGCSTGVMLDIFAKHGWETWGVEPSESAKLAEARGHKIINEFFESAKLPKNYFNLVITNHTLEHMDDPLLVLKKIYGLLKRDGLVYIDVPNAGGLGARLLGKYWPYRLPDEHKHQFTRQSLSQIFKEAGFKVIHFESRSGLFEFANPILELWHSLAGLKMRFFTNLLTLPYALVATALNMGDSMSMIGRKI